MRNILITIDSAQAQQNHEYIHINDIQSIINHSCDSITINCLEYLSETDHQPVISSLLNKLRNNGKLVVKVNNSHNIAQKFIQKSLSNFEFLSFFSNKKSIVSIETLYTLIDFDTFNLIDTDIQSETLKIVVERKKYE